MPGILVPLVLPAIASLAAGPVPPDAARLPGGDSTAFRERMMLWSAPAAPETTPPAQSPVPKAKLPRLSSRFGYRSDPLRGARRMHAGIDIPGTPGTPVQASSAGIVRFAGTAGGYGQMVEIDHGGGIRTRYAHLARILVAPGRPVVPGEAIATMGSTGRSTGSHLHFEVRAGGRAVDPLRYLGSNPIWRPAASLSVPEPEAHVSAFARARAAARQALEPGF